MQKRERKRNEKKIQYTPCFFFFITYNTQMCTARIIATILVVNVLYPTGLMSITVACWKNANFNFVFRQTKDHVIAIFVYLYTYSFFLSSYFHHSMEFSFILSLFCFFSSAFVLVLCFLHYIQ